MKKYISIFVLFALLVLPGCDMKANETITCSDRTETNFITTDRKYVIDYKDNDIKKMKITYDYNRDVNNNNTAGNNDVNADGTTNNNNNNNDNNNNNNNTAGNNDDNKVVDGVVGEALEDIVSGLTDTILDVAGLRDRHNLVQTTYKDVAGFETKVDYDDDNHYKVEYTIDFDKISNDDLKRIGIDRNLDTTRSNYISQGLTCK